MKDVALGTMDLTDVLLSNKQTLHTSISALSDIDFHYEKAKNEDSYEHANHITKKHVRMLDGLSLLVFQDKGEVCAMTFVRTPSNPKEVTIYWAKNDPAPPSSYEQQYLNSLLRAFQTQTDGGGDPEAMCDALQSEGHPTMLQSMDTF